MNTTPDTPTDFDLLVGLVLRQLDKGDLAGWLSAALVEAAELAGGGDRNAGAYRLIAGRPGSWEAQHVFALAGGGSW